MVSLENNNLVFRFPAVHAEAVLRVDFQRTLRLPDDNREYPLPPGLGRFPLAHVDDHADRTPSSWARHGGVFLPMYQAEAMWIHFDSGGYPFAVKIAAGKVNAVTGDGWSAPLQADPQDYLVTPPQPWLDGFAVQRGTVRQFVAMPLGQGYTAEEQLTSEARHGGIQISVRPLKREVYARLERRNARSRFAMMHPDACAYAVEAIPLAMGLAPGGLMSQDIYDDPHGIDAWETSAVARCFVHIANSAVYHSITGQAPPTRPPTAAEYTAAGLPWFSYYDETAGTLPGSKKLAGLDSVGALDWKKGEKTLDGNDPVVPSQVVDLRRGPRPVRQGDF